MELCMMSMALSGMTPREIVQAAQTLKLTAIDWIGEYDSPAIELRKLSEDAGLRIAAHTSLLPGFAERKADWLDVFKRGLDFCCGLGAKVLLTPPFPLKDQKSLEEGQNAWKLYYEKTLPLAQQAGVFLCVESTGFVNSPVTSAAEQLHLVQELPGLKVAFDCGNTSTAGDDPVQAWKTLKDYVVHMHCKDYRITDAPVEYSDRKRCGRYFTDSVIGKGALPIAELWKTMKKDGYTGAVNLETADPSGKLSPVEVVKRSAEYLRSL